MNESFVEGMLTLFRAVILGLRRSPDDLRALLVMLPPVDLTWVDVGRLLHWENLYGYPNREHFDIPEGWTLGPALDDGDGSGDVLEIANSNALVQMLKEHPEFKNQWEAVTRNMGSANFHLSYHVVTDDGKATEIARFIEGKLKPWRDGEPLSEAEYDRIGKRVLAGNIYDVLTRTDYYGEEMGDEETDELLDSLDFAALPKGWPDLAAEKFWDSDVDVIMVEECDYGPVVTDWQPVLKFLHELCGSKATAKRQLFA